MVYNFSCAHLLEHRDKYFSIISTVSTDVERIVACMTVQYEDNWATTKWLDTILKMLKPKKERFSLIHKFMEYG
jgi:hypothetical protein